MRFLIWISLSFAVLISPASSAMAATNCGGDFAPSMSITAAKVDGHIAWLAGKDKAWYPLWTTEERKVESAKPGSKYYCEGPGKNAPVNEWRHGPFKFNKLTLNRKIWCRDVAPLLASTGNTSTADCLAKDGEFDGVTEFKGACFRKSDLRGRHLRGADLRGVNFFKADLSGANLAEADLTDAILECANLTGADLDGAILKHANLNRTMLEGAFLGGADVEGARFEPVSLPPARSSFGIKNLDTVTYVNSPDSLAKFQRAFAEAGMSNEAQIIGRLISRKRISSAGGITGPVLYVLLGLTSDFGFDPWRPLVILGAIIIIFALFYQIAITTSDDKKGGIWKVWPEGTVPERKADVERERLKENGWGAFCWALYFSLVSAFHFGFRGVNVGNWIGRISPGEYVLRGTKWVKVLSGIQALVSIYLFGLWVVLLIGIARDIVGDFVGF